MGGIDAISLGGNFPLENKKKVGSNGSVLSTPSVGVVDVVDISKPPSISTIREGVKERLLLINTRENKILDIERKLLNRIPETVQSYKSGVAEIKPEAQESLDKILNIHDACVDAMQNVKRDLQKWIEVVSLGGSGSAEEAQYNHSVSLLTRHRHDGMDLALELGKSIGISIAVEFVSVSAFGLVGIGISICRSNLELANSLERSGQTELNIANLSDELSVDSLLLSNWRHLTQRFSVQNVEEILQDTIVDSNNNTPHEGKFSALV